MLKKKYNNPYKEGMMKRLFLIITFFVLSANVFAADMRIAYYDSDKIRVNYPAFAEAQAKFDKEIEKWQAQADSMEVKLNDMKTEYEKQYLMLSDEKRQEREALMQQSLVEYQTFLQQIFGDGGLAEKRNAELTQPLIEEISKVLQVIAENEGYTLILDVAGTFNNIAYIDESLEITDDVVAELKKYL